MIKLFKHLFKTKIKYDMNIKQETCIHEFVFQETEEKMWDGKGCGVIIDYYDVYICKNCGKKKYKR